MFYFSYFCEGCRGSSGEKPLATNCNACRYVMNAVTGECLKECPKGWDKLKDNTCRSKNNIALVEVRRMQANTNIYE